MTRETLVSSRNLVQLGAELGAAVLLPDPVL